MGHRHRGSVLALAMLHRNVLIGTYRADFVLELGDSRQRLIMECDGHEFHDRTKQQAAYDRARDRELHRQGFVTYRFTGSEIWHSAERCAAEVIDGLRCLRAVQPRRAERAVTERGW